MVFAVAETVAKRVLPTKEIRLLPAKNLGWKIQYVQDGGSSQVSLPGLTALWQFRSISLALAQIAVNVNE